MNRHTPPSRPSDNGQEADAPHPISAADLVPAPYLVRVRAGLGIPDHLLARMDSKTNPLTADERLEVKLHIVRATRTIRYLRKRYAHQLGREIEPEPGWKP